MNRIKERINEPLPDWIKVGWFTIILRTEQLDRMYDFLSRPTKSWQIINTAGVGAMVVSSLMTLLVLVAGGYRAVVYQPEPTGANEVTNAVVVPGVNDAMPVAATIFILAAVLVSAVVHEFGHAISAYNSGEDIEETGLILLLGVIPIAAYVKADHPNKLWQKLRFFSAGILQNFVLFGVTLAGAMYVGDPWLVAGSYISGITGGIEPTARTVAQFTNAQNFLFWTWFISLNLAIFNTLPIRGFDGGHFYKAIMDWVSKTSGLGFSSDIAVKATSIFTVAFMFLVVLGPVIFNL